MEETIHYSDGSIYIGEVVNKQKQGSGEMTYPSGNMYDGEWNNDKKHGKGKMTYVSKSIVYQGEWFNDTKHGNGKIYIDNCVIYGLWENGMISLIDSIYNPDNIQLSIDRIMPFISAYTTFIPDFYELCGYYQSEEYIQQFIDELPRYNGTIVIAALCHGRIDDIIKLPNNSLRRISKVPNGVCSISTLQDKLEAFDICMTKDSDRITVILNYFRDIVKLQCNTKDKQTLPSRKKMVDACSGLTSAPEKTFTQDGYIFNKIFSSIGRNFNVLLLINDKGNYVNLFSNGVNTILLSEILNYMPSPNTQCVFIDSSCSTSSNYYTEKQLNTYGGKKKKTKKKIQRK